MDTVLITVVASILAAGISGVGAAFVSKRQKKMELSQEMNTKNIESLFEQLKYSNDQLAMLRNEIAVSHGKRSILRNIIDVQSEKITAMQIYMTTLIERLKEKDPSVVPDLDLSSFDERIRVLEQHYSMHGGEEL